MTIYFKIRKFLRPLGKIHFLSQLPSKAFVLGVGCGNNSPYRVKQILPKCHYVGIDVGDYNQTKPNLADEYITTSSSSFPKAIKAYSIQCDAVISTHNLEHCENRNETLKAMLDAVKPGGKIFIAFPSEKTMRLPHRRGTLNYADDPTHKQTPPDYNWVLNTCKYHNFVVLFATQHYQPFLLRTIGFMLEPISHFCGKNMLGTWEYHGFETIVIAEKSLKLNPCNDKGARSFNSKI